MGVPAPPSGYRVIAFALRLRRIEPRSLPFGLVQTSIAGAYAAYSITHDLGFCGLLNMVTFDGDVGIVFVEAYNYLSDLSILVQIICRI